MYLNRQINVYNHYVNHISSMSSHLETLFLEMNPLNYFLSWAWPLCLDLGAGLAWVWVSPGSARQLQGPCSETRGAEPQENT